MKAAIAPTFWQVLVVLWLLVPAGCSSPKGLQKGYLDVVFPNQWKGDIDPITFTEPSGICWHPGRGTLFVIGDEGDICELKTDGSLVKYKHLRDDNNDFEGITCDPSSGLLYVAVEGAEAIVEVDPESFDIRREFSIPRDFQSKTVMQEGANGFEGITFMPDPAHPQGGTFYVANQSFVLDDEDDISAIFQVELPLRSGTGQPRILSCFEPGVIDLAGMHFDPVTGHILVASDATNMLFEYSPGWELVDFYAFPGDNQEGITVDSEGFIYIAQDTGGIIKLKWLRPTTAPLPSRTAAVTR